jgi:hypothetical protein
MLYPGVDEVTAPESAYVHTLAHLGDSITDLFF